MEITGYRQLSEDELELINRVKALGQQFDLLVQEIQQRVNQQFTAAVQNPGEQARLRQSEPDRWVILARNEVHQGLMALVRAVAQPTV